MIPNTVIDYCNTCDLDECLELRSLLFDRFHLLRHQKRKEAPPGTPEEK
jgi:hypothetical protein